MASPILVKHMNAIKEQYRIYLQNFGSEWKYLENKRSGVKCTCFDDVRGEAKRSCKICEGTGYVVGLSPPKTIKCSKMSTSQAIDEGIIPQQQFGNDKPALIWTIDDAPFSIGDFMISDLNQVYEIVSDVPSIDETNLRTVLTLRRIPETNETAKRVREGIA